MSQLASHLDLSSQLNNLRSTVSNMILLDVISDAETITIIAELPGIDKNSINIDFYNNKVTITATKIKSYNMDRLTFNPISEIYYGTYRRTVTVPICVTKKETVKVNYTDGMLYININKFIEEENKFSVKLD